MILVKKLKFFQFLCLSNIDREILFADVLDKKQAFQDYKINCLQKDKIRIFQKRLVHRFGQKFEFTSILVFTQNRPTKSIWKPFS